MGERICGAELMNCFVGCLVYDVMLARISEHLMVQKAAPHLQMQFISPQNHLAIPCLRSVGEDKITDSSLLLT